MYSPAPIDLQVMKFKQLILLYIYVLYLVMEKL